jgi:hypothetical protein
MQPSKVEYCIDFITENQRFTHRAIGDGKGVKAGVYTRAELLETDPSPWSDKVGATCNPGTFPLKKVILSIVHDLYVGKCSCAIMFCVGICCL